MGNPFINAVYIGHPGWKAMGGRIGYSAATGVMVIVLSWLGIIAVMSALIPLVAISPILLYIGMLIGAQAFQETPKAHAPAIVLAGACAFGVSWNACAPISMPMRSEEHTSELQSRQYLLVFSFCSLLSALVGCDGLSSSR